MYAVHQMHENFGHKVTSREPMKSSINDKCKAAGSLEVAYMSNTDVAGR
jgi:hypothetical protein